MGASAPGGTSRKSHSQFGCGRSGRREKRRPCLRRQIVQGLRSDESHWYQTSPVLFFQRVPGGPPSPSEGLVSMARLYLGSRLANRCPLAAAAAAGGSLAAASGPRPGRPRAGWLDAKLAKLERQ